MRQQAQKTAREVTSGHLLESSLRVLWLLAASVACRAELAHMNE